MVFHNYKCIFLHIPKTAGRSVTNALGGQGDIEELFWHETLNDHKKIISEDIYSSYFKFAFVRNPWDRIASYYFSKQNLSSRFINKRIPSMKKKFSSWIKEVSQQDKSWYMKKPKTTCDAGRYPILHCQQIQYLTEDMSTEGRIAIDFVGKFESLRKDLDHIEEQIGIKINLPKDVY